MQQIRYDDGKLATMLAGSGFMTLVALCFSWAGGGAIPLVAAAFFALCGGAAARGLLAGRPALQFDDRQVTVSTLVRSTTLPWSQVVNIRRESLVIRMYGFIPVGRTDYIVFDVAGGVLGTRKVRIASKLLDRSRAPSDICALLEAARTRSGAPAAASPRTPEKVPEAEPESSSFDADAAIARYLARKSEDQAASPAPSPFVQAQRPAFGRKQA